MQMKFGIGQASREKSARALTLAALYAIVNVNVVLFRKMRYGVGKAGGQQEEIRFAKLGEGDHEH
jgi:hypothetical protein